jgi:hypothetical protein
MNTDEFEDRLEAMRTNPDMVAYYPKIAALAAFDSFVYGFRNDSNILPLDV